MAKNDSFFNEIYGTYFNVVSSILRQAQEKQLTKDSLELLVREQAFADSCLTIPKALQDGSWPLLQKDMTTPLRHAPAMPLTTLQRRWLKSLLTDERNALELAMLHFSHLEKITERLDEKHYRLQLMYNKSDETEMVIRILSFGPLLRVQEPSGFIELLRCRLCKQLALRADK